MPKWAAIILAFVLASAPPLQAADTAAAKHIAFRNRDDLMRQAS